MVIELTDVVFYKKGIGGVSRVVGNDWDNDAPACRVARYTITAPETGANGLSLKFITFGIGNGSHIPIRYYIGQDPESHIRADDTYAYTGELTLDNNDHSTFTATADVILMPNNVYYIWVFPGNRTFGWYYWVKDPYISTATTLGSAFLIPVVHNGKWWHAMTKCVWRGKIWLCAICVVNNGKWYLAGSWKRKS